MTNFDCRDINFFLKCSRNECELQKKRNKYGQSRCQLRLQELR